MIQDAAERLWKKYLTDDFYSMRGWRTIVLGFQTVYMQV